MSKSKIFFGMRCLLSAFLVMSCDDTKNAYPPTFKGFQVYRNEVLIIPKNIKAGDEITIVACQDEKGKYINSTYYNWTFKCNVLISETENVDSLLTKRVHVNYDGLDSSDPKFTFTVPEKAQGAAFVEFSAEYNYSADGIQVHNGNLYDQLSYVGAIYPNSGTLSGGATGSFRFLIQ